MAKRPVSWHESCLVNVETSIERDLDIVRRQQDRISRDIDYAAKLRAQIAEAKKRGLDAFDSDRMLVKRIKK